MKNFITISKFVFAFLLLCSSSALAYDQQYQPGDTGPNGGIITQVTVTSTDGDPVVTTVGDQQTTTVETTYVEEIIEATTSEVVTTQITQVETREVSGTTTTDNVLIDIDPSYSGDVHNYGSSDSVSDTMLIFGPNGGTVTSQFSLNTYMTEEQWQGGFDIDAQGDMLNCFNTQTTFQCGSSTGGPADSFTMTITVTDGSESYESVTTHTIDNGPTNFQSYSASLTVPQNNLTSSATATIQGYGYDVGNYDLSDGTRGDGQPTYLGPLLTNPSVTITHNLYQTVIQQIEQQITNTITEYITTQLTATESASTTITIETEETETTTEETTTDTTDTDTTNTTETETVEVTIDIDTTDTTADDAITTVDDDNVADDTVTEIVQDVVETIVETITETVEDQDQGHDNNNNNDSNNNAGDWSEPEPEVTIEVEPDITEIIVELPDITEDTEIVIVDIEEEPVMPKITQEEIDNILDRIEVVVSDAVGDIVNMTVDLNIDDTGGVQVEIVSVNMAPEVEMTDMASPMPQPISTEDMSTETSMAPPPLELPAIDDMPDMMPEMPATGMDIANDVGSATSDMPSVDMPPSEMVEAISEAVSEMANIDAAPVDTPVAPRSVEVESTTESSGDIVIGETNDAPMTTETESQPQQQESQQTVEAQPEPEPQQEVSSNENKNETKNSEQKTEQKTQTKQTKATTTQQKKQEVKQKIAQKILTRVLQNQNVTISQVDATRLTLMTSLADTVGFNNYQNVTLLDRDTWYVDTKIYDLPQMVDPLADILSGAQNMQMDSLIDSQYKD